MDIKCINYTIHCKQFVYNTTLMQYNVSVSNKVSHKKYAVIKSS